MSQEIKECPFCGVVPTVNGDIVFHDLVFHEAGEKCILSNNYYYVSAWNLRATVSLSTAQELADSIRGILAITDRDHMAWHAVHDALARFDAEKGRP